jgi:hypothetical protein
MYTQAGPNTYVNLKKNIWNSSSSFFCNYKFKVLLSLFNQLEIMTESMAINYKYGVANEKKHILNHERLQIIDYSLKWFLHKRTKNQNKISWFKNSLCLSLLVSRESRTRNYKENIALSSNLLYLKINKFIK